MAECGAGGQSEVFWLFSFVFDETWQIIGLKAHQVAGKSGPVLDQLVCLNDCVIDFSCWIGAERRDLFQTSLETWLTGHKRRNLVEPHCYS
jgi:hypothetical protein